MSVRILDLYDKFIVNNDIKNEKIILIKDQDWLILNTYYKNDKRQFSLFIEYIHENCHAIEDTYYAIKMAYCMTNTIKYGMQAPFVALCDICLISYHSVAHHIIMEHDKICQYLPDLVFDYILIIMKYVNCEEIRIMDKISQMSEEYKNKMLCMLIYHYNHRKGY